MHVPPPALLACAAFFMITTVTAQEIPVPKMFQPQPALPQPVLPPVVPTLNPDAPPAGLSSTPELTPLIPVLPSAPQPQPVVDHVETKVKEVEKNTSVLRQAVATFNQATRNPEKFLDARKLFDLAFSQNLQMTAEQVAAWSYCRIKVAADTLNRDSSRATAQEVVLELVATLRLIKDNEKLQQLAQTVLSEARKRLPQLEKQTTWKHEYTSKNFVIRYSDTMAEADAEKLARKAESLREALFTRWSGPSSGAWKTRCVIYLHADAQSLKQVGGPMHSTGHSVVKIAEATVTERSLHLRSDDSTLLDNALPREMSYIVLADLYPTKAPPLWASLGMAVLASTESEINRYTSTLSRTDIQGRLLPVAKILQENQFPTHALTEFCVQSVTMVDFLVRWRGAKAFTSFLRDAQRYGIENALKRQYDLDSIEQLEALWRRGYRLTPINALSSGNR